MARDAAATRAAILTAARAEFSAHGLAGARVDRMAVAAGCSKERLYAGFGDKFGLYRRVMSDMLEELRLATIVTDDMEVDGYVRAAYDFHRDHPHLLRMLLWESLEGTDDSLPDDEARRDCYRLSARALAPKVPGDDPRARSRRLLLTLVGLTAWPHAVGPLAAIITDGESQSEEGQRSLREFVAAFAAAGVRGLSEQPIPSLGPST